MKWAILPLDLQMLTCQSVSRFLSIGTPFLFAAYSALEFLEAFLILFVTLHVPGQFRLPVFNPGFWNARIDAALVLMPEAAADFDDFMQPAENHVRLAG